MGVLEEEATAATLAGEVRPALGGEMRPVLEVRSALVGEAPPALVGEARPALVGEAPPVLGGEARPALRGEVSALIGEVRPAPRRGRVVVEAGAASAGGCALAFPSIRLRRSVRRWTSSALSSGISSGISSGSTISIRALSAVATKRSSTHGPCGAAPGADASTEACAAGRVGRAGRSDGCALAAWPGAVFPTIRLRRSVRRWTSSALSPVEGAETGSDDTEGFERCLRGREDPGTSTGMSIVSK